MKIKDLYKTTKNELCISGIEDFEFEARLMLLHFMNISTADLYSDVEIILTSEFIAALQKRKSRYPLQYILGEWDFMGLSLFVGEGVLIPRNDTETLVREAYNIIRQTINPEGLDLCAGTGAAGLGLCSLLNTAKVTAVELYEDALYYLNRNISLYPQYKINSLKGDITEKNFADIFKDNSLDFILSNPPYIERKEYETLEPEIMAEPETALVAQEHGLHFYKIIASYWAKKLKPGGLLAVETGDTQGKEVSDIFGASGFKKVEIKKDLSGHDRVVIALKR